MKKKHSSSPSASGPCKRDRQGAEARPIWILLMGWQRITGITWDGHGGRKVSCKPSVCLSSDKQADPPWSHHSSTSFDRKRRIWVAPSCPRHCSIHMTCAKPLKQVCSPDVECTKLARARLDRRSLSLRIHILSQPLLPSLPPKTANSRTPQTPNPFLLVASDGLGHLIPALESHWLVFQVRPVYTCIYSYTQRE